MLICVYDTANEAEILKAKITQIATAAYRRIAYRVCQGYESFVNECKTADLIIVLADGADGMEGVIVKSNMVYTLCKHMVYMLSITNEHKNELEIMAKPEWKVHFLCFASAKRGSFSIR